MNPDPRTTATRRDPSSTTPPACSGPGASSVAPDDAELPLDLRRDVVVLEERGAELTHYQLLGIAWGAGADEAGAAYRELVKRYHPDRHGARRLGPWRARLEGIVRRLTEARDTLCDDGRRSEYEERTAPPEEVARRTARRIEDELRADERRARLARTNPIVARAARAASGLVRASRARRSPARSSSSSCRAWRRATSSGGAVSAS